eukprot:5198396-Lingulodinium_polyedra.AAC.1
MPGTRLIPRGRGQARHVGHGHAGIPRDDDVRPFPLQRPPGRLQIVPELVDVRVPLLMVPDLAQHEHIRARVPEAVDVRGQLAERLTAPFVALQSPGGDAH